MTFNQATQGTTFLTNKDLATGQGGEFEYIVVERREKEQVLILNNLTTDHQMEMNFNQWYLVAVNLKR